MINLESRSVSDLLKSIKLSFAKKYSERYAVGGSIWQSSFWDHVIRDEDDFYHHLNYIHFNPVKHGLVKKPFDYQHSSIIKFKEYYSEDWGIKEEHEIDGEFGE
jgi:putative transposase